MASSCAEATELRRQCENVSEKNWSVVTYKLKADNEAQSRLKMPYCALNSPGTLVAT